MWKPIRIFHLDGEYRPHYVTLLPGLFIHSRISLEEAISLLRNTHFDLILSEPQEIAILCTDFQQQEGDPPHPWGRAL